jgi:hypothetical protein
MNGSKVALGVAALLVGTASLTMMSPGSGEAQIGSTPVRVVNTPLPIAGNVNAAVTGNVNATITGAVDLAPGTTVTVGNSPASPLSVRDVGDAQQLTHGSAGCFFANFVCKIDIATVPVGQRLVITHISGNINVFNDLVNNVVVGRAFLDCCIATNSDYLAPQNIGSSPRLAVNHQTLMFFEGGDTVRILVEKQGGVGNQGVANFSYAGHFVAN